MGKVYKKNFLDKVIARLDFATELPGIADTLPAEVAAIAVKHFPIDEPKKVVAGKVQISPIGEVSAEAIGSSIEWHYHGKNREKSLCVAPRVMFIVHKQYQSFDIFKNDFLPIVNALFNVYGNDKSIVVKRFGLRYINSIHFDEDNPVDWTAYLAEKLLPIFEVVEDKKQICRAFNNLILNYDDMLLKFQYGMHNSDYPALIRSKDFILDFDAFYQGLQDEEEIKSNLDRFHDEIEKFFEQCITDELREVMNQ